MTALADAADAIYRFAAGQDLRDRDLYESAFTADAVLDFSQPAQLFGADVPPMVGRTAILDRAFTATTDLVTTHTVTNVRWVDQGAGQVYALVEAMHVSPGRPEDRFLLKNNYWVTVARDSDGTAHVAGPTRISHLVIENVWASGDPAVLFGAPA